MSVAVVVLEERLRHLAGLPFTAWAVSSVALALVCWLGLRQLATAIAREWLLVALSLVAIALVASTWLALAWLLLAVAFRAVVESGISRPLVVVGTTGLLAGVVVLPVVALPWLVAQGGHVLALTAFASNMALLRLWAYAADRWRGLLPPLPLRRYLVAVLFFPTFVNGPVEVARALPEAWPVPSWEDLAIGLRRIARGCMLMVLVGLLFPPGWTAVLAQGPGAGPLQLWAWAALLYLWFFASFGAWSEVAIGLGRLCGRVVQENFLRPWQAVGVSDFWRRWHVSLGLWLRAYVYVPLGGRHRWRRRNVLLVFAVSAAWHVWGTVKLLGLGYYPPLAWAGLGIWAAAHALAVAFAPRPTADPWGLWRVATCAFVAWAWIPFFLPASVPPLAALGMLVRMLVPWCGG